LAAQTNRIVLSDPVFISDLHLSAQTPQTLAAFTTFVDRVAVQHAELVILGDLFEYWVGDDHDDAISDIVIKTLRSLTESAQVKLYLMHGNRDLLLGPHFCGHFGATLLQDPTTATISKIAQKTLLSHGDAWCTQDTAYQQFRAQVHNPDWQRAFLAQSLTARTAFVQKARMASASAKTTKALDIMDVTPSEITKAYQTHDVAHIVHGHTHRPAVHHTQIAHVTHTRWVLPDWDFDTATPPRGGYLRVCDETFVLESVVPA